MADKDKRKPFAIAEKQRENLNTLSKEELIDYIMDLFQENPGLIVDDIETTGEIDKGKKIELDHLIGKHRDAAERCFHVYAGNLYDAAHEAEHKLYDLLDKAEKLSKKDKKSAAALLTAIFAAIDDNYSEVDDSDGGIAAASGLCVDKLTALVPESNLKPGERHRWQQRMFNRYIKNDYGIADGVTTLLLETCKKEDMDFLKGLVEEVLEQFDDVSTWNSNYMKGELSRFLAELHELNGEGPSSKK